MRNLPPLAQLRGFEAAARHLSFQTAAQELAVTPTAISHQIKLLEGFCGVALFRRRPRPLTLTEAGVRIYPIIRDGLDGFAATLSALKGDAKQHPLAVTTTNAFASRWLLPKLPQWYKYCPDVTLEVIGTDDTLDLRSGECDLAIRCTESAPPDFVVHELMRGTFAPMCSPALLHDSTTTKKLSNLRRHTLINWYWSELDIQAPTWSRWLALVRSTGFEIPDLVDFKQLTFREELHAIEAVVAGQGIALLDEVIVADELNSGALVKAAERTLPGPGYYLVHIPNHPRIDLIERFKFWVLSQQ
jgi:LysR family glycine cleavage system transcriptional activator